MRGQQMPRRNNRYRIRRPADEPTGRPATPLTTEEMARDLVRRGLASALILDRPFITQKDLAS